MADDTDWAVAILFYAAMHHVESFFASAGLPAAINHQDRREKVRQHFDLPLRQMYYRLYQQSRRARYDGWYPSAADS
ncbi:MAG TPA: hypothetical protein VMW62_04550 [Chloroflexota bacterium]|nr:hypothetical protein [Chloroflexota bacterium]